VRSNRGCELRLPFTSPLNEMTLKTKFQGQNNRAPARAVCCDVLNLLSQVGPYPETPPWLRPIALFLYGVRDPKSKCWLKTEGAASRTLQGRDAYTIKTSAMVEKN
jgi:hypothetical protein